MAESANKIRLLKRLISISYCLFFLLLSLPIAAQSTFDTFFKPQDTLHKQRRDAVVFTQTGFYGLTLIGLDRLWYSDYPGTKFQFAPDGDHWLQMDKAGHVFSAYYLSKTGADLMAWSGVSSKGKLLYGAGTGFLFMTAVEVMDGYSDSWGFSWSDMVANALGTGLYVTQELLWNEQRIVPKFSFHTTPYAAVRPNALGATLPEQVLKDYNGQTYWLAVNVFSFTKATYIPPWLTVAIGYGAEGMITAKDDLVNTLFLPEKQRVRQFYLSLDVDLTKIATRSHFLKTVFSVLNTVKIPAPAFEIRSDGRTHFHLLYF